QADPDAVSVAVAVQKTLPHQVLHQALARAGRKPRQTHDLLQRGVRLLHGEAVEDLSDLVQHQDGGGPRTRLRSHAFNPLLSSGQAAILSVAKVRRSRTSPRVT